MNAVCIRQKSLYRRAKRMGVAMLCVALCACSTDAPNTEPARETLLVERDIEAPDVFQTTETGLWDGNTSLSGVWVAHPEARDPERVIIRNTQSGAFVIGALFRADGPPQTPRLRVSSDAAAAIGLGPGEAVVLDVTALRRAEPLVAPASAETEPHSTEMAVPMPDAAQDSAEATAGPPAGRAPLLAVSPNVGAGASEGLASGASTALTFSQPPPAPPVTPTSPPAEDLSKPFIQIGIFSVQANATRAAARVEAQNLTPIVKPGATAGQTFWRVIVGPADSRADRDGMMTTIQAQGFEDAYAVTN